MKILVTGIQGQLGYDVGKVLDTRNIEYYAPTLEELDVTNRTMILKILREYCPDAVIHCAAYTAVDKAEDEPEKCWSINVDGTRNLAEGCKEIGAKMLYVSTDYVFPGDGDRFYEPDDLTGPLGVYGKTKLEGELAVQELLEHCFIVRISWVFGLNGNNFVKTMLRIAETKPEINVVRDQIGSPTYTVDLARLLCDMIATEKYGVYHATNEGICSWAEFAREIFRLAGQNVCVNDVPTREYPTRVVRPLNSRMSKDKLEEMGFSRLPTWQNALGRYLKELERSV